MRLIIIVIIIVAIAGCASGVQKMRKIDPGMSYSDIDNIMGRRDSFRTVEKDGNTYTLYQYTNQFCNAHVTLHEKCDFFVIFKDGRVVETGVKDVRDKTPNMQYIHLFQY
ncbi:MAG: hypothetical protein PF690_07145 [Deltaproteobacteria bacterium]|jgi:hypothetical protein|nr:hypothetical protein [Deltaproteobacteria bacterium]